MTIAVLGSTGRLGKMLRWAWQPDDTLWLGRKCNMQDLRGVHTLIDMRGVVPGRGRLADNIEIACEALDLAAGARVGRVFLPSSAAVYGQLDERLTEDVAQPETDYGHAKLAMEQLAQSHGQCCTCLRIGNVAGADAVLGCYQSGFRLDQFSDGTTPRRSYIGPRSFAETIQKLAANESLPPVLNLAAPGVVQMGDLLDAANLPWTPVPAPESAIAEVRLDTDRLASLISLPPNSGTAEGIVAEWSDLQGS